MRCLKERIAALEQRNAANRPTSPTAGVPSGTGSNVPHAAGFKDKIAKFEKKGGVPVPRGRFGLGAPPTVEGPRKQGELYGNRIPAPVRHVSAGAASTLSAAGAAPGDSSTSSANPQRRSFSLSNFNAEFDEEPSRSPSPSFQTTLNGTDTPSSPVSSPELSTSALQPAETPVSKHNIIRGTSFQKAMELARNVENAKQKSVEQAALHSQTQSPDVEKQPSMETADPGQNTPVILLSAEDTPSVVLHSSPTLDSNTPSFIIPTSVHSDTTAAKLLTTESEDQHIAENVGEVQADEGPNPPVSETSETDDVDTNSLSNVDMPNVNEADASDASTVFTVEITPATVEAEPPRTTPSPKTDISLSPAQLPAAPASDDCGSNHSLTPSQKVALTLESDLSMDALMSPLSSGNISATILADALTDYFQPESLNGRSSSGTVTPPVLPTPAPLSPAAKLAYDAPDSELSIILPDHTPLLSPIGSFSSAPATPGSADEINSASVSQATRVTPTTGRGVPLYLPSNAPTQTRKSDFVYFPPTPEAASTEFADTAPKVEKKVEETKPAFRTVVHEKVFETAPGPRERLRVPETPQTQRFKRTNTSEPPPSPGQGELAALWYEAALLESSLEHGELPAESVAKPSEAELKKAREAKEAEAKTKSVQEKEKTLANGAQNRRSQTVDETTSATLKHTFLMPLSRAKTSHRKEVSASATTESFARPPVPDAAPRPKSSFVPDSIRVPPRPVTPDNNAHLSAHSTPSKSPKQRFGSFRRLGSINMSRPSTMYSTRHSQSGSSEMSSEDSPTILTPVEQDHDFGYSRSSTASEFGQLKAKASTPSLSSKKSANSVSRATSFAGKMWSRARTKSNGSTLSSALDDIPRLQAPLPDLPGIQLPHLPHITAPPPIEKDMVKPPQRATSLKHPMHLPALPSEFVLPLPTTGSSAFFATNSADVSGDSLMLPDSSFSSRPPSWASFASTSGSSLPQSPLFDESFINSFPSVPETTTLSFQTSRTGQSMGRSANILTTVKERPSLDTALVPTSAQEAGENHRNSLRSSSRSATPTPR
ncbi:hypothetical protein D9619_005262 [Psilocybe cf. subviscida]|uniref:Uncharacterized protein n=1 Tax=Psilocybe cf. subviscida TaxID=2480587 RepID=A0A8H5FC59_9AGAR|nr:hypothetical protein D9619_005262 [Psilocybe cf. subviscida]